MIPRRCIYYMPRQTQKEYWEDQWAQRRFDKQVADGPKKQWWPILQGMLDEVPEDGLILEGGCGMGQFVHLLHEQGRRVLGVDIADQTLEHARQRFPDLDLQVQDVGNLALPDASVAMYISLGVVEHVEQGPDALLAEAARVVADSGILFITVPYFNLYRRLREPWWRVKHLAQRSPTMQRLFNWPPIDFYQYAFSVREFSAILRRHGFEPERLLLHHSHVALKKDFGNMRRFQRRFDRPDQPGTLDSKALRQAARKLDEFTPALMSHMMLVVARRRIR